MRHGPKSLLERRRTIRPIDPAIASLTGPSTDKAARFVHSFPQLAQAHPLPACRGKLLGSPSTSSFLHIPASPFSSPRHLEFRHPIRTGIPARPNSRLLSAPTFTTNTLDLCAGSGFPCSALSASRHPPPRSDRNPNDAPLVPPHDSRPNSCHRSAFTNRLRMYRWSSIPQSSAVSPSSSTSPPGVDVIAAAALPRMTREADLGAKYWGQGGREGGGRNGLAVDVDECQVGRVSWTLGGEEQEEGWERGAMGYQETRPFHPCLCE